jgi:hypothetical protein
MICFVCAHDQKCILFLIMVIVLAKGLLVPTSDYGSCMSLSGRAIELLVEAL